MPEVRIYLKSLCYGDAKLVRNRLRNCITFSISSVKRSGYVSDCRFSLKSTKGDDLRHLVFAVLANYIIYDFLTPFNTEVYINIRHAHAFRVEKPLKDEAVFNRVYFCYIEAVGNDASCGRTSARPDCYTMRFGVMDEVPDYQEVLHIAHALYYS